MTKPKKHKKAEDLPAEPRPADQAQPTGALGGEAEAVAPATAEQLSPPLEPQPAPAVLPPAPAWDPHPRNPNRARSGESKASFNARSAAWEKARQRGE